MQGMINEAVSSYSPGAPGALVYSSGMMPPHPQHQSLYQPSHAETTSRYMRPEPPSQSPTRQSHLPAMLAHSTSPIMSTALHGSSLARHRGIEPITASPGSLPHAKTSPLSLASITSPYHPDQPQIPGQQKNYHAQTLILGERLRPGSEDPVTIIQRVAIMPPVEVRALRPYRSLQKAFQGQPACRYLPMPFNRRSSHHRIVIQPVEPWARREGKEIGIVA
jgi:hypothetical protein